MQVQWPAAETYFDWKDWGAALVRALQTALEESRIEVGAIREFRGSLPEDGYLPANGSTFDSVSYPDLFAKLGTNVLPNLASAYGAGNVVGIKT